jgi:hypothetical protein
MNNHGLRPMGVMFDPSLTYPVNTSRSRTTPSSPDHARHIEQQRRVIVMARHYASLLILPKRALEEVKCTALGSAAFWAQGKALAEGPRLLTLPIWIALPSISDPATTVGGSSEAFGRSRTCFAVLT